MITIFKALAVNQGDAFYFERNGTNVLIDGGSSKDVLIQQLNKENIKRIDIIVVTHNDFDHSNGIIGLLEKKRKFRQTDTEIWVPCSFGSVLEKCPSKDSAYDQIIPDYQKRLDIPFNGDFKKEMLAIIEGTVYDKYDHYWEVVESSEKKQNNISFPRYSQEEKLPIEKITKKYCHNRNKEQKRKDLQLLSQIKFLLVKYNKIKKIIDLSKQRKIKIRYFEYTNTPNGQTNGGKKDILEPVNSVEKTSVSNSKNILALLKLSLENKYSLVFCSPKAEDFPGILFSADSDFSFNQTIPWKNEMIITVPHHGSASNNNVYQRYHNENKTISSNIWVKTYHDKVQNNISQYYRRMNEKYCVRCKIDNHHSTVVFQNGHANWVPNPWNNCVC